MEEPELPQDALKRLGDAASKHWVLIAAALTITSFAAGLAHVRGYLAALGFESLLFSLPPEHYVAIGAVALAGSALIVGGTALFVRALSRSFPQGQRSPEADAQHGGARGAWSLAAASAFLILIFVMTWRWLAPLGVFFPVKMPELLENVLLLVAMLVVIITGPYALARLRGQAAVAFVLALAFVATPTIAQLMGQSRAANLVDDVFQAPRVVVWRNETSSPEGYVVVHQDGDVLYVVYVVDEGADPPIFRSTMIRMPEVQRVDFIPAGGDDSYAFPLRNGAPG